MSWIRARFVGTCVGERLRDPGGAKRFRFELHSGRVFDPESIPAPAAPAFDEGERGDERDATPPGEYRQPRVRRVCFPTSEEDPDPRERTLFDVRISDFRLRHPAEVKGRAYSTMEGTLRARLVPETSKLAPPPLTRAPAQLPPALEHSEVQRDSEAQGHSQRRLRLRSPSDRFDASRHFARLRAGFAILAVVVGSAALAIFCSVPTAAIWAAPVVIALLLRRLLRAVSFGTRALQGWLGVALIAGQGYLLVEPLQTAWRMGCRMPIREDLLFIAAPVVLAALLRRHGPLLISSALWTAVMCAWCTELGGTCTASAAPIRASVPATAGSRTDADGRWPAMLGDGLPRNTASPGADGSAHGLPSAALPSGTVGPAGSEGAAGSGSAEEVVATRFEAPIGEQKASDALPIQESSASDTAGLPASSANTPNAASASTSGPSRSFAASSPRRSSASSAVEGGWISADHRNAARELTLISIEHANRRPHEFFESEGTRRVYLPTDSIFDATGTRVSQAGALQLARLAALLSLHPDRRALLELHTDAGGSAQTQLQTSQLRAAAVRDWLQSRGHLSASQLAAVGAGASRPLVPPDGSYAAQQPNRRLEVSLLD